MLNSWQFPMAILATKGLCDFVVPAISSWRPAASRQIARWVVVLFVAAVVPTNVYLFAWRFVELERHSYSYYMHSDEIAVMDWLRGNTSPDDVVLASLTVGQYVPAISGNTAFLAHWAQTVDFYDKEERVARFFDEATSDEARRDTVCAFGVDYVIYGPAERALGDYDLDSLPWLTEAFSSSQVQLFRVDSQTACQGG
jgi:hypothetical protein